VSADRPARTLPEWATLCGAVAVLLVVVVLIAMQIPGGEAPAAPTAELADVRRVGGSFHVDVVVENGGDRTAADVQVSAELTVGDETFNGDQLIDFLSGGEDVALTFVFGEDPANGELRARVTGYRAP
jgi:uncharacterized protein (TIGR02588 family)